MYLRGARGLLAIPAFDGGGSLGSIVGGQGPRARVILVLRECIRNTPVVLLVFPAFADTSSLGSPPRQVVSPPV